MLINSYQTSRFIAIAVRTPNLKVKFFIETHHTKAVEQNGTFTKFCLRDQINEYETGRPCNTHGTGEKYIQTLAGIPEG